MNNRPKVIFLHGASSSGKSTLARAIQGQIELPFWHISIDHLRDAGVLPLTRVKSGDFVWREMRAPFFNGFHASLAAYLQAGNNLIIEHILDTPGWQSQLASLFEPFDVFFVGVHCGLDELQRREAARGDRPVGSAEQDFLTIHKNRSYDLTVQSENGAATNLETILAAWRLRSPASQFFNVSAGL